MKMNPYYGRKCVICADQDLFGEFFLILNTVFGAGVLENTTHVWFLHTDV